MNLGRAAYDRPVVPITWRTVACFERSVHLLGLRPDGGCQMSARGGETWEGRIRTADRPVSDSQAARSSLRTTPKASLVTAGLIAEVEAVVVPSAAPWRRATFVAVVVSVVPVACMSRVIRVITAAEQARQDAPPPALLIGSAAAAPVSTKHVKAVVKHLMPPSAGPHRSRHAGLLSAHQQRCQSIAARLPSSEQPASL